MTQASVLIVEDDTTLSDVYGLILSAHGYTVHKAGNGKEGIEQIKKHVPKLVLLDMMMPVMDARQFFMNIDLNDFPDTKIVVTSNLSEGIMYDEILSSGADQVVLKSSMNPSQLIKLVGTYFP